MTTPDATELPTGMPDDAPTTTASTTTTATPAALWSLLVDPSSPAAFSDEFQGAEWKDTEGVEPPALGARFIGRNESGRMGTWTTLATITVHEPMRRHGWTIQSLDEPISDWVFAVEQDGDGRVLTLTCRLGPSPLSGLVQAIAKHPDRAEEFTAKRLAALHENMQRTVEGIAALAERATDGGDA